MRFRFEHPFKNQKGRIAIILPILIAIVLMLGLVIGVALFKKEPRTSESSNRRVLAYEEGIYCQLIENGVKLQVVNPAGRYLANASLVEQWIEKDKLSLEESTTAEARLINKDNNTYTLELPADGKCY